MLTELSLELTEQYWKAQSKNIASYHCIIYHLESFLPIIT